MKDTSKLIKELRKQGFTAVRSKGSQHWKIYNSEGRLVCSMASTPSDHRSLLNSIAHLKRAGFVHRNR